MDEIALLGLEFFAHHGFFDHEKEEGNNFLVDIRISCDFSFNSVSDELSRTIDYQSLYNIAAKVMKTGKVNLIETLAQSIIAEIVSTYPYIPAAEVSVAKLNPPITGKCREARVTARWQKR